MSYILYKSIGKKMHIKQWLGEWVSCNFAWTATRVA
ncbi:protein of unknown function [Cupriavidus taiwanensis]|nr:hypothetical protein CBM2606_A90352 [Cupriavidus taiwanensis]SPA41821.1 protein of unknown function [Cupriavidus taiwanensis]